MLFTLPPCLYFCYQGDDIEMTTFSFVPLCIVVWLQGDVGTPGKDIEMRVMCLTGFLQYAFIRPVRASPALGHTGVIPH